MAAFRVFLIALALTAPVWALHAGPAEACTCGMDLARMVDSADLIILGTADDVSLLDGFGDQVDELRRVEVESTISVDTYLLGSGPDTLQVRLSAEVHGSREKPTIGFGLGANCGYAPEVDARHLLFIGREGDGSYRTGGCAGFLDGEYVQDQMLPEIRSLVQAVSDLPKTGTGASSADANGLPIPISAFAGLAAVALAAAVVLRRTS